MSRGTTQSWRIDAHHHVRPPRYADDSMPIKIPDPKAQLRSMDSWANPRGHYLAAAAGGVEKSPPAARRGA
jgi:hypothetical protein